MPAEGAHTATIQHSAASADLNYNGFAIASVTAHITDNDSPGVVVTESSGGTDVTEGGATDTYSVVLNTQPTANVTVTLVSGAHATVNPTSLLFTPADWNRPQDVTVTAVDDALAEGAHTATIHHNAASADLNYNGIAVANVTVHITDNDSPGVVVDRIQRQHRCDRRRRDGQLQREAGDPAHGQCDRHPGQRRPRHGQPDPARLHAGQLEQPPRCGGNGGG